MEKKYYGFEIKNLNGSVYYRGKNNSNFLVEPIAACERISIGDSVFTVSTLDSELISINGYLTEKNCEKAIPKLKKYFPRPGTEFRVVELNPSLEERFNCSALREFVELSLNY